MTRIKICGITSVTDALVATASGVDAVGLVFYPKSPRCVTVEQAADIAQAMPPFTTLVGLFVNATERTIQQVLDHVPLGVLQFHGDESETQCNRWSRPYIKVFRVRAGLPVAEMVAPYASASGFLLDSYTPGVPGGTGEAFDWGLIPDNLGKPVILAGGLHAGNVRLAIETVQPYGVDVSSGVEAHPGHKDSGKIKAFIKAVGRN
ncbi:phosphoribosylanthranilate isomerase [Candidatus Sororendozoicomonas aggregata]|uniref:phosphoribosylanthranilate isomerase n=1 Tax=Candidatus Sororendozoicomonas aggregata TaxID=3073239 RepID=UPI002ED2D684